MTIAPSSIISRLAVLGVTLPDAPRPLASYVPAVRMRGLVYTSGQLPIRDGILLSEGLIGRDLTVEAGAELARLCTVNALAAIAGIVDLDAISRVVKVTGFVASTPDFTAQSAVIDGASTFLEEVFGDAGKHSRSAVGVAALPLGAPVEVELVVALLGD